MGLTHMLHDFIVREKMLCCDLTHDNHVHKIALFEGKNIYLFAYTSWLNKNETF